MQPRISPDGMRWRDRIRSADREPGCIRDRDRPRNHFPVDDHMANDWFPVWSPDGKQLLFAPTGRRHETPDISKRSLEPSAGNAPIRVMSRPTGHAMAAGSCSARTIWALHGPCGQQSVRLSCDTVPRGRRTILAERPWLAYSRMKAGSTTYTCVHSPGVRGGRGKIQVSSGGGDFPVWRKDGKELYYMDAPAHLRGGHTAVGAEHRRASAATRSFAHARKRPAAAAARGASYGETFDTLDGKRFLVTCPPSRPAGVSSW